MLSMIVVPEIIREDLSLPRADLSHLAEMLIESLETEGPFAAKKIKTLNQRFREIRDGSLKPFTLEQLQRHAAARLA